MKLLKLVLLSVRGDSGCPDLGESAEFQAIQNGALGQCSGSTCQVKCDVGYHVSHMAYTVPATCSCGESQSTCKWSYGQFGSGESGTAANWGCCKSPQRAYGHAWSAVQMAHNYGAKTLEADERYALMSNKIVVKDATTEGYSILLVFDGVLPDDVAIDTFARFEMQDIYRDSLTEQTFVMMSSRDEFDELSIGQKFNVVFGIQTTTTNAKELVENTNYKIKFYTARYSEFCAGNGQLAEHLNPSPVLFGSFNIQVFGQAKYKKDIVKDNIIEILKRYDISTIQEIRDSAQTAFPNLVNDMNDGDVNYDWHTGARQGSTSSKEQYGFIWNSEMFELIDAYDFDDSETGWFERPPTIAYFNRLNPNAEVQKFMVISTHIKPETGSTDMTTEDEINHLEDVYNEAVARQPDYTNGVIAGDMNADCTYVYEPEETLNMYTDDDAMWLFDFDSDTTVKSTNCAYDHIILKGEQMIASFKNAAVFRYDEEMGTDDIMYEGDPITELISDHYPVEFSFQ